jgi:nickel transport protein
VAHDLKAAVHAEADPVRVEAGYDDDTPAEEARVTVTAADGTVVASGRTDERGTWSFPRPGPGRYTVAVESAGHRDAVGLTIPATAVEAPVVYARERLDKNLGLVIGLVLLLGGTLAFVLFRRSRKTPESA